MGAGSCTRLPVIALKRMGGIIHAQKRTCAAPAMPDVHSDLFPQIRMAETTRILAQTLTAEWSAAYLEYL